MCQKPVLNPIVRASLEAGKHCFYRQKSHPEGQSGSRSSEHLFTHKLVTTLFMLPSQGVLSSYASSDGLGAALVLPAQTLPGPLVAQ